MSVDVRGAGDTAVLLLHGLGGSRRSWLELPRDLSRMRRVITPDLRGCGESERGSEPYSFALLARDACAVLDAVGVAPCHVVGHSLGGVIAQELLTTHPERCASAVLISTSDRVGEKASAAWLRLADQVERRGLVVSDAAAERGFSAEFAARNPAVVRETARATAASDPAVYAEQARIAATYDYAVALKRVDAPVLVLQGLADRLTGAGGSVLLSRSLAHAELRMLEGAGHNLHVEMNESLAGILEAFFDRVESHLPAG